LVAWLLSYSSELFNNTISTATWARAGAVGWGTALQAGRSRVRFPSMSLVFFIDLIRPHCDLEVDWASNSNEYQAAGA
jgi:hypothetical protein